jgi:hypothetical protein
MRDKDVRLAMKTLVEATGEVDEVSLKGLPTEWGSRAGQYKFVVIQPDTMVQQDLWDGRDCTGLLVTSTCLITVLARDEDPQVRDELAERLVSIIINQIQGKQLALLSNPDHTRFVRARFLPPKPPERRVVMTMTYDYILDSWWAFDSDDEERSLR